MVGRKRERERERGRERKKGKKERRKEARKEGKMHEKTRPRQWACEMGHRVHSVQGGLEGIAQGEAFCVCAKKKRKGKKSASFFA